MVQSAADNEDKSNMSKNAMGQNFQDMMKPENIGHTMRQFIPLGGQAAAMSEIFIDKVNMQIDGGQLMQASIYCKNHEMVKTLITRGCDLDNPPQKVPALTGHPECHIEYRRAPYIIQAACYGDKKIMEMLVAAGCSLNEVGHIALSKRHKNSLAHNVIGAAAYHGNTETLAYCLKQCPPDIIDVKGQETSDRVNTKGAPFKPEMHEFTPLQLALVSPKPSLDVVKTLFAKNADQSVKQASTGSNILHLVAGYMTDIKVLSYVVKNARVDIFDRNNAGDTPLTICNQRGNEEASKIIEECQEVNDQTAAKTDELMAELMGAEEKNERARLRKKEKKHRSKLQKLAEKHNCSVEQLEQVFKEQEEQKRKEERERELAAQEAERQAELAAQREKQERIAELNRLRDEGNAIIEQQEREEREKQAAEKTKRLAAIADKKAKYEAQMQQQNSSKGEAAESHQAKELTRKQQRKKEYQEAKRAKEQEAQAVQGTTDGGDLNGATPGDDNSGETPQPATEATPAGGKGGPKITGLTGDLAIQMAGKNTRKKLLEEQKREELEKQALKERIQKANQERELQRVQKLKEAQQEAQAAKQAAKEAEQKAIKDAQIEAKKAKKKEQQREKRQKKKEQERAAAAEAQQNNQNNNEENTPAPDSTQQEEQKVRPPKPAKAPRVKAAKAEAAAENTGNQVQQQQEAPSQEKPQQVTQQQSETTGTTPKHPRERKSQREKNNPPQQEMVYQKKRPAAEPSSQPQPASEPVVVQKSPAEPSPELADVQKQLQQLQKELQSERKARGKAEKLVEQRQREKAELEQKFQQAQEQILELEQDTGLQSSVNERELTKQIKKLTNQLNQQVTVNKSLSAKLMKQEKAFIDEQRAKIELEKRLNVIVSTRPPVGPGGAPSDNEQMQRNGVNDLAQMQNQIASVNQRVQYSLQQR